VAAALGIDRSFDGHDLTAPGGLEIRAGTPPVAVLVGPRVGIDYAAPTDRNALWRFACADSGWVSARRSLSPAAFE
jgi:DNA-3-methyladenine glycosylase